MEQVNAAIRKHLRPSGMRIAIVAQNADELRDLLTTGNPDSPEFQAKLKPGDVLKSEIEGIGAMNQGVAKES